MQGKLDLKTTQGYGIGSVAEASVYTFMSSFLLIYLTSVVGIDPGTAGTITSVALLIESASGVVIGKLSDSCRSRYGRRRPFMLASCFLLPLSLVAVFFSIDQNPALQFFYYTGMAGIFWIGYSIFYIPYTALGAEITTDYDERTRLRSIARVWGIVGTFAGTVFPLLVTDFLVRRGRATAQAWLIFATMVALCCGIVLFVTWAMTRGTEPAAGAEKETGNFFLVIKDYYELMRLKAMKVLVLYKVVFTVGFTFYTATLIFFLQYKLGLSSQISSSIYFVSNTACLLYTPLISWMAVKMGKQNQLIAAMLIPGAAGVVMMFTGVNSYSLLLTYVLFFAFAQSSFWQISSAIFYDITEVDDYVYHRRREGNITSLQSIVGTLTTAVAMQVTGILLKVTGFDSLLESQPELAVRQLEHLLLLYPSVCLIASGLLLFLYPISRKRFIALQNLLWARKNEGDVSIYEEEARKVL